MGRVKQPTKPADLKDDATKAQKEAYEAAMDTYKEEMDEYLQKQAAIASILTNSWPDDVHQQLLGVRPVHKLWSSLCALFENKSILGMVDVLVDLLRIECTSDEDEDVLAVIDCFIKKRNEYISAGGQLPDDVYAAFLIKAMPSTYRSTILTTVTTATTMGAALNFDIVHAQLKEAIQFDVAQANRKRKEAKAMAAKFERHKQQQQQKQQPQQAKKPKCTNCSYTGHTKEVCRKPGGNMEGIPLSKKDKGSAKGKGKAAAAEEKSPDASEHHAYVATAIPDRALRASSGKSIRLLDTGASQHYDGNAVNSSICSCASCIASRPHPELNTPHRLVRSSLHAMTATSRRRSRSRTHTISNPAPPASFPSLACESTVSYSATSKMGMVYSLTQRWAK
jgi:hypothetical protein